MIFLSCEFFRTHRNVTLSRTSQEALFFYFISNVMGPTESMYTTRHYNGTGEPDRQLYICYLYQLNGNVIVSFSYGLMFLVCWISTTQIHFQILTKPRVWINNPCQWPAYREQEVNEDFFSGDFILFLN